MKTAPEPIHVQKALTAGLPIIRVCRNEAEAERVRRYLREQGIEEDGKRILVVGVESTYGPRTS